MKIQLISKKEKEYIENHIRLISIVAIIVIIAIFLCANEAKNPKYYTFQCEGEYEITPCMNEIKYMGVLPPDEFSAVDPLYGYYI